MKRLFTILICIPMIVGSVVYATSTDNQLHENVIETAPVYEVFSEYQYPEPTAVAFFDTFESEETESAQAEEETEEEYVPEYVEPSADGSLGTFRLTAYCACSKCCGSYAENRPKDENGNTIVYTATGAIAKAGVTIAVDPRVIPYGTEVIINGHTYIAQDTGGAIVGNKIDVYFDNHEDAWNFGVQYAEVFVNG